MRKYQHAIKLALLFALTAGLPGCGIPAAGNSAEDLSAASGSNSGNESVLSSGYDQPELHRIKITAEDEVLYATLFDNDTALDFSNQLPLTVPLWVPANFAKAFDLDSELFAPEELTREYQVGGIAYWPAGPSVAIFHGMEQERTAVPVVIIGKLEGDASFFVDYTGDIAIETDI